MRFLFVASTGGHLEQLARISTRFDVDDESLWITFDSVQSRSLLAGKRCFFVPYVAPRDWAGTIRALAAVLRRIDVSQYDHVVSTGAAVAVGVLPALRLRGLPATYIESVSRTDGPSLTGRILAASHMVQLRTQHESWARRRWKPTASVFATYRSEPVEAPTVENPRLFVTLGTIRPYRFDSLLDAVRDTPFADTRTTWQVGESGGRTDLPGQVVDYLDGRGMDDQLEQADVVVTHAGVGSVLKMVDRGIYPVVVPRRRARGEHVDDHQAQICGLLQRLGLAEVVEAPDLDADTITAALRRVNLPSETNVEESVQDGRVRTDAE
ncbi:glycosyltransferase [Jatrophihabitans sp. YIM 134969]